MKRMLEIQITKVRIMTLITSKTKTNKTSATILATQETTTKAMETKEQLYQEQPSGETSQCISHIEWTCQQGTAVQDTRSTETSIAIPG